MPICLQTELKVHYENNSPFLTVTNLERIIEVSHWGNIAVEEHISMRHTGALLKGPFSRYDYQRAQDGLSSIKSFKVATEKGFMINSPLNNVCDNRTWISKCLNASSLMFWIHFRLSCQLQLVMCTIEMKLATFLPVTLRRWMILLS